MVYGKLKRWNISKWQWMIFFPFLLFMIILLMPLSDPLFNDGYSTVLEASNGAVLGATIAEDGQWRFPEPDSVPYKFKNALLLFDM